MLCAYASHRGLLKTWQTTLKNTYVVGSFSRHFTYVNVVITTYVNVVLVIFTDISVVISTEVKVGYVGFIM